MMQNNSCEAFELLKKFIIENCNGKLASGGKEVRKRCHICGDSIDPTDRHMYIGIDKQGAISYYCFKCGGKVIDANFLRDIGCYDQEIINLVLAHNKACSSSNNIIKDDYRKMISNPYLIPNMSKNTSYEKIEYLGNRIGQSFSPIDMKNLGIILNISDFFKGNNIQSYTRSDDMLYILDQIYFGFLSVDRSYIIMRRIIEDENDIPMELREFVTRYVNYNIFNREGKKIYVIPTEIDPFAIYPIRINIAEGPITLLGIYFNTDAKMIENSIFACCGGKAYEAAINYFIREVGLINIDIHIYPDADVDDRLIRYKISKILDIYEKVTIHRNSLSNDFGVPKDQIKEYVYQIFK